MTDLGLTPVALNKASSALRFLSLSDQFFHRTFRNLNFLEKIDLHNIALKGLNFLGARGEGQERECRDCARKGRSGLRKKEVLVSPKISFLSPPNLLPCHPQAFFLVTQNTSSLVTLKPSFFVSQNKPSCHSQAFFLCHPVE